MPRRVLLVGAVGTVVLVLLWWATRDQATAQQGGTYTPLPTLTPLPGVSPPRDGPRVDAPLRFPDPLPRLPPGESFVGGGMPTPLPTPRSDADIRAYVETQLARVAVQAGTPRMLRQRPVPPGMLARLGLTGLDDGHQVVVVAACDCDARALFYGRVASTGAPARYLVWVVDRRYPGGNVVAAPEGPWVQAVLREVP